MKKLVMAALLFSGSVFAQVQIGRNVQIGGAGSGTGTVTSVSVTTANGFQGTVSSPSTTPSIQINVDANHVLPVNTGSSSNCLTQAGTYVACSSGGAVSSVSNSDSSLTVSPTTGAVVASLNTAHANTWTAAQTFNGSGPAFKIPLSVATGTGSSATNVGTDSSGNVLLNKNGTAAEVCDTTNGACASGTLTDNILLNSTNSPAKLFIETDSIGLIINGGFPQAIATDLGVSVGNQSINSIGSASMPDMLSCDTTPGCTPGGSFPYQIGAYPLTFPLGVTSNSRSLLQMGFNDLSNMGPSPSTNQLSYYHGSVLAWGLMFGIPDSQKLTPGSCTTTGTWSSVSAVPGGAGTFPAGTIKTTTPGATITCTGFNATDAGFISYKSTGSTTATFTVSVTNAGTTYNVADSYTGSTTLNQTAYYTTAWGGTASLYAIGQPGMAGGYTSMTLTASNNSSDPVIVVMPYFISPSSSPQNAPAVQYALTSREGCNGTCGTISGHSDASTNLLRTAQISAANELRSNGINASYFDPNATPLGFNSSDANQQVKVTQFTVTAGGSLYTSPPTMTVTGCMVAPTGHVTISGGAVVTGTFLMDTVGSCNGGTPAIGFSGGGGSGAAANASVTTSDGTHPNVTGAQNIANAAIVNFNSAAQAQDHFLPIPTPSSVPAGCTDSSGTLTCAGFTASGNTPAIQISASGSASSALLEFPVTGNSVNFTYGVWGPSNGAGLPNAFGLFDNSAHFVWNTCASDDIFGYTPISNVCAGAGAAWSILHTGVATFNQVTAGFGGFTTSSSSFTPMIATNNTGSLGGIPTGAFLAPSAPQHSVVQYFTGVDGTTSYGGMNVGYVYAGGASSTANFAHIGVLQPSPSTFDPGLSVCSDGSIATGNNSNVSGSQSCPLTGGGIHVPSAAPVEWNSDTGLSRDSAGVVDVGNGTAGNKSGTINAANYGAGALANGMTATTQSAGDNSTKVATTAYVDGLGRSFYAQIAPTLFTTATMLGPVYESFSTTATHTLRIMARLSGTITCSSAPQIGFYDLGTSPTTAYGSATELSFVVTGTSDGVYQNGGSGALTGGHYYGFAIDSGTCATPPTIDATFGW